MSVSRGVAAAVAVIGFLMCAPAWASTEGGHATSMHSVKPVLGRLPLSAVGRLTASAREASVARTLRRATVTRPAKGHLTLTPTSLTFQGGRMRLSWHGSNAKVCTLSSKPRFWSGRNPARVKCRGKITATLPALALGVHWRFTFKAKNAKGKVSTVRRTLTVHKPPFAVSSNWSGYVVPSATPVTSVSGGFTVPKLNCARTRNGSEAAWVGIGGAKGAAESLLQTGVVSECVDGLQKEDPGWWEEYPDSGPATLFSMTINPGDEIEASVSQSSDLSWTTTLDDRTTHVSGFMHTGDEWGTYLDTDQTAVTRGGDTLGLTYSGGTTAEWIVEDFSSVNGLVPFADFGTVTFTGLATSVPAWALTANEQVGLGEESGLLLAAPSAPDSTGKGFSVAYTG